MTNNGNSLNCSKCHGDLHPIGNLSYGPSRITSGLRKAALIGLVLPACLIPVLGIICYIIPVSLVYCITACFPKTTKINCHHCGHKEEVTGKMANLTGDINNPTVNAPHLAKTEVHDHSKIRPNSDGRDDEESHSRDEKNRRSDNRQRFNLVGSTPAKRFSFWR